MDHRVELDELEALEGGGECASALPEEDHDARDVLDLARERGCDRCLGLREGKAHVSSLEGAAVVCAVTAHTHFRLTELL